MGQRHQIFLHVRNDFRPMNYPRALGDESNEVSYYNAFGRLTTTVLAYHHQWLYGCGPLGVALSILNASAGARSDEDKYNPFRIDAYEPTDMRQFLELCNVLIATYKLPLEGANELRYSMARLLNNEHFDMRHNFSLGDNNDGVTLVDTLTGKYCFMNIGRQDTDEECQSVARLEMLVPCSAEEYVRAYYPEDKVNPAPQSLQELQITGLIESFKAYEVMSWVDIDAMFPTFKPSYK